jgi:hypothetical protein
MLTVDRPAINLRDKMATLSADDEKKLVGTFRRLGEYGPVYEIVGFRLEEGSKVAEIEVPESGEKTTLSVEEVLSDPQVE